MRSVLALFVCCSSIMACKPRTAKLLGAALRNGSIQEQEVNKNEITVAYIPPCWQPADTTSLHAETDTTEMIFQVSIHPRYDARPLPVTGNNRYNFDRDTLFMLVAAADTIPALYARKIMNGNIGGITYLVGFDKGMIPQAPELDFVFRAWMFNAAALHFSYERSVLEKIDALSCSE